MAMDPMGGQVQLPGQHLMEPTFGLPATLGVGLELDVVEDAHRGHHEAEFRRELAAQGPNLVFPGQFMAMDPMGGQVQLPGQHLMEPTFGLPATWVLRRSETWALITSVRWVETTVAASTTV
jgi:flagellar biosynthesis component FlhA